MTSKNNNEPAFYVVQFIDLPYEGIDDYVCVPNTWMIVGGQIDQKAVVTYPADENPFDTRDRVRRKEICNDAWKFYVATIKYESNSYLDAQLWIATKKDPSSLVKEESKVTESNTYEHRPTLSQTINNNMKIPSIRQNLIHLSNLAQQRQMQPNDQDSQQQPQRSKLPIGISKMRGNRKQITSPRRVTKKTPPSKPTLAKFLNSLQKTLSTTHNNCLSNNPQLQAITSAGSTGNINVDLTTSPQNIVASETRDRQNTEMPNHPIYQPSRKQHTTAHENGSKLPIGISNMRKNRKQITSPTKKKPPLTLAKVLNSLQKTLSTTQNNCLSNNPQLQAITSAGSTGNINVDLTTSPQNIVASETRDRQNTEMPNHPIYQPSRKQHTTAHEDGSKLPIGISNMRKNRKQITSPTKKKPPLTLAKVLNSLQKTLSTTQNNCLSNNPQLQTITSARSTGNINVDLTTIPQNIAASETRDRQNIEMSNRPIYQPSRKQHTTAHEDGYQNLCTQRHFVDRSTRKDSKTKRVHFVNDTARSPINGSHQNVTINACQTDECMVNETLSQNHTVTSNSHTVMDHEDISYYDMSIDKSPVDTTNNVYGTANDPGQSSADRPTAAQNSMSKNPKTFLEQQNMLDNFATLLTKMGSILPCTNDTLLTEKGLGGVKQLNTARNASLKSKVTASASSRYQNQHSKGVAKKTQKRKQYKFYRLVLPSDYDAYDTKWTLKYRTIQPGLVELMPQSGVYVSYGELEHSQQVSKNCKSLALRLLPEVFSIDALSVCLSMTEKVQASKNVGSKIRPDLDEHSCLVLLSFVLLHGLQRGWNTDIQPILSTLHSEMLDIRSKYGVMVEC